MSTPQFTITPQTIAQCDQAGRCRLVAIQVLSQALDDLDARDPALRAEAKAFCLKDDSPLRPSRALRGWWCERAQVGTERLKRAARKRLASRDAHPQNEGESFSHKRAA